MKLQEILEEFEVVLNSPEGLKELRSLILGLAVRGKLVPQDPNDEPASELLGKIEQEKQKLIEKGEIRKPKELPPISDDEIPFEIPESWKWCWLGDIYYDLGSKKPEKRFSYIDVGAIDNRYYIIDPAKVLQLNPNEAPSRARRCVVKGSVIYSTVRPYLQNVAIIDKNFECEPIASTAFEVITTFSMILNKYIYRLLLSDYFKDYVSSNMVGVAYPAINKRQVQLAGVPLPPFNEQHRIVAKIEDLFAEVDELEKKLNKQFKLDETLQLAVNSEVQKATDKNESNATWNIITSNFDDIYHSPESIENLKKNILNEAVRGRLVPQDPNDEPASELMVEIEEEKQKLYEEGEIRKPKKLPPISEDEIPFEIPKNWEWCRLSSLGTFSGGGTPSKNKPEYWDGDLLWISPKDMKSFYLQDSELKITKDGILYSSAKIIPSESILIVARSGILKRTLPVSINKVECAVNQDIKVIIPHYKLMVVYLAYMLKGYEQFILKALVKDGMTVQSLKYQEFEDQPFPIPPLLEQQKIVKKIDDLIVRCNKMKSHLEKKRKINSSLIKGLVHEVLDQTSKEVQITN